MVIDQQAMLTILKSNNILEAMGQFDEKSEAISPFFKFVEYYKKMVLSIYTFAHASRNRLWQLHISSVNVLCKACYTHDKQNYTGQFHLMTVFETTYTDIQKESLDRNFTVNKSNIPLYAVRVDHVPEYIRRTMKVTGGMIGITQNVCVREIFVLIALQLNRLTAEAHKMAGSPTAARKHHHDLSMTIWTRREVNILKLMKVASVNNMTGDC